jgi:hypothetical protein
VILTRRSFLAGIGAGLIAPKVVDQFWDYLAIHGEPMVPAPRDPVATLFVSEADDFLVFMRHMDRRTWADLLALDDYDLLHRAETLDYWEITEAQLGEEISPRAYMAWSSRDLLVQRAADLLMSLDLGHLHNRADAVGGVRFQQPPYKSKSWQYACCEDALSVSLLQLRLNELNTGIRLTLA